MLLGCNMSLRCECGYDLTGLTGDRCPECGSTVTRSKSRWWSDLLTVSYLLGGFSIGFLASAALWVSLRGYEIFIPVVGPARSCAPYGQILAYLLLAVGGGLLFAVVTGLFGMLIGYIVSRKKPYLLRGLLAGFSLVAVPTVIYSYIPFVAWTPWAGLRQRLGTPEAAFAFLALMVGLAIAVGTGLVGMLIGYGVWRRGS